METSPGPVLTALIAGLLAAVCIGGVALTARAMPAASTGSNQFAADSTPSVSSTVVPVSVQGTLAGQAVSGILEALPGLFPRLSGGNSARGYYSSLLPADCQTDTNAAYDGATWFASAAGSTGAMAVTVLTVGPGYAQEVLARTRAGLSSCGMNVVKTGAPTGGAFVASGAQLRVEGWARGDVVVMLASDAVLAARMGNAAERVDELVVRVISPLCASLGASYETGRNPYLGAKFTGDTAQVSYRVAPMQAAPVAAPGDTLEWVPPVPVPAWRLAVANGIAGIPSGSEDLTLIDPMSIPYSGFTATTEPVPPVEPEGEISAWTASVRTADAVGPGCGWKFLGVKVPESSSAELARLAEESAAAAASSLASSSALRLAALIGYVRQSETYAQAAQEWNMVSAQADELARAQAVLTATLASWTALFGPPPITIPVPTPAASASNGVPVPSGPAVPSPVASPSGTISPSGTVPAAPAAVATPGSVNGSGA